MRYYDRRITVEAYQVQFHNRNSNDDWPAWMHQAWNKDHHNEPYALYRDEWCDPKVKKKHTETDKDSYHYLLSCHASAVIPPPTDSQFVARVVEWGNWLVRYPTGYITVMDNATFHATYFTDEVK